MDQRSENYKEIMRLRAVIRDMEENHVKYPFKQNSKVFGVQAYCNLGKIIYLPVQCYYIAPHRHENHVIQGLMGKLVVVKDVFATKEEAELYIEENNL